MALVTSNIIPKTPFQGGSNPNGSFGGQSTGSNILPKTLFNGGTTTNGSFNGQTTGQNAFSNPAPVKFDPTAAQMASAQQAQNPAPVKKQTFTGADGSSTVTEYHPPATGGLVNSGSVDNSGGTSNPNANYTAGVTQQQAPQGTSNSYSGLIGSAVNSAQNNGAIGQQAASIASNYGKQIASIGQMGANAQAGYKTTGTSPVAEGNAAVVAQNTAAQQQALATGESVALQGTQQQLTAQNQTTTGLLGAGGLAAPLQVPYSNQLINPQTGESASGGTTGTLPAQAQSFVDSLAQQVKNGQMTRDEATSQLSAYGPAGLQALNTSLGANFNTNASNASAGTTATGQQIQTAADSTNKALDTLSTAFSSLSNLQTGGIPLTNNIAQWIGTNLGDPALQQYKTNLADARSQLIGVLNSAGGTPTGNEATANQYLPDNMTAEQFNQNVGTAQNPGIVRQLIAQKVGSFTSSGQQNATNSTNPAGWY